MRQLKVSIGAGVMALALVACGNSTPDQTEGGEEGGLPDDLVWSTHSTGTSTYADLAAAADAITSEEGTSIRIITSDTSVGRLTPVREGQAQMTRLGDEFIYAFEGDHEFASEDWGPQDVQVVWAPVIPAGMLTTENSEINSVSDLEGMRLPLVTLNPSVNNKIEAYLESAGLTTDDVEFVEMGYGEQPEALQNGQIDALYSSFFAGNLFELDGTTPVEWLDLAGEDVDQESFQESAPSTLIQEASGGPGQEGDETVETMWYTVPIVTMADAADEDLVYETVRAIDEAYDLYQDTTQTTEGWNAENVLAEPQEVPYHPGTIRYLEEQGLWTEEAAERNDELNERGEELRSGWQDFIDTAGDDVATEWTDWKNENVPEG